MVIVDRYTEGLLLDEYLQIEHHLAQRVQEPTLFRSGVLCRERRRSEVCRFERVEISMVYIVKVLIR